jgi:hypothetical protein
VLIGLLDKLGKPFSVVLLVTLVDNFANVKLELTLFRGSKDKEQKENENLKQETQMMLSPALRRPNGINIDPIIVDFLVRRLVKHNDNVFF